MGVDGNTVDVSAAVSIAVVVDCDEDTADLSAVVVKACEVGSNVVVDRPGETR